jgi:hypothetical protein
VAAISSAANGAWSSTATWAGGVVPGIGDTVTLTHDVSVTDARTVGTSPSEGGTVVSVNTGGILRIANTGVLTCRGDVALNGGRFEGEGAGRFLWDASAAAAPTTTEYRIKWTTGSAATRLVVRGMSRANPFVFDSVKAGGASNGWIDGESNFAFRLDMQNAELNNMGVGTTVNAINCAGYGGQYCIMDGVRIRDTVGRIDVPLANDGDLYLNDVQNESAQRFWIGGTGALTTNRRTVSNTSFRSRLFFTASHVTLRNVVLPGFDFVDASVANVSVWENVLVDFDEGNGSSFGGLDGSASGVEFGPTYFLHRRATNNNPHYLTTPATQSARALTYRGWVMQSASPDAEAGDIFLVGSQSGRSITIRECIGLPNWGGVSNGGAFVNVLGGGLTKVTVDHNTVCAGGTIGGVYMGETGTLAADPLDSVRSNIFWRTAAGLGAVIYREGATNNNVVADGADVGHNTKYNYSGNHTIGINQTEGLGYISTVAGALFTGTLSALTTDNTLNPSFVAPTRDIRSYARSCGYGGSDTAAVAALLDALYAGSNPAHPKYNPRVSIAGLLAHVSAGFEPTNLSVRAAHDATVTGWRGAVAGLPVGLRVRVYQGDVFIASRDLLATSLTGSFADTAWSLTADERARALYSPDVVPFTVDVGWGGTGEVNVDSVNVAWTTTSATLTVRARAVGGATGAALSGSIAVTATATGAFAPVPAALVGTVAVVATTGGALTVPKPLTGTLAATATVVGTVTVPKPLTGTLAAVTTATGALTVSKPLAGSLAAAATVTGALAGTGAALVGAVTVTATTTGAVTVPKPLVGTVAAAATLTGAVTAPKPLAGAVALTATVVGVVTVPKPLTGALAVAATVDAQLAGGAAALVGSVVVAAQAAGVLTVPKPLSGGFSAVVTTAGAFGFAGAALGGTVSVATTVDGAVSVPKPLAGGVAVVTAVDGALTVPKPLTGSLAAVVTATGTTLTVPKPLTGALAVRLQVTGNLTADVAALLSAAVAFGPRLTAAAGLTARLTATAALKTRGDGELGA